jgi:ubiquitin-conjugating enzyme E2 variant
VSGWWNPALDGSGLLKRAERAVYAVTGVAPRCWSDDDHFDVQEEAPEGWGNDVIH